MFIAQIFVPFTILKIDWIVYISSVEKNQPKGLKNRVHYKIVSGEPMDVLTKDKSTKKIIIDILSSEWPLSLSKIYYKIKKKYGLGITYQAVHKAINELTGERILKKEKKEYQLSIDWINKIENFGKKLNRRLWKLHLAYE